MAHCELGQYFLRRTFMKFKGDETNSVTITVFSPGDFRTCPAVHHLEESIGKFG